MEHKYIFVLHFHLLVMYVGKQTENHRIAASDQQFGAVQIPGMLAIVKCDNISMTEPATNC